MRIVLTLFLVFVLVKKSQLYLNIDDNPYYMSLHLYIYDNPHCSGSLILPNIVLTTAQCCKNYNLKDVTFVSGYNYSTGSYDQRRKLSSIRIHSNYDDEERDPMTDLCMLQLEKPVRETNTTRVVTTFGRNIISNNEGIMRLKCGDVKMLSVEECNEYYRAMDVMFCLYPNGEDTKCHINEGAPIMDDFRQVGLLISKSTDSVFNRKRFLVAVKLPIDFMDYFL